MPIWPPTRLVLPSAALLFAVQAGCAAHRSGTRSGTSQPSGESLAELAAQPPILPAIVGQVYARGTRAPADPIVGLAASGDDLDEALSGAAAALALRDDPSFTIADARWAAWRAGYPFMVRSAVSASTEDPAVPEAVRAGLIQARQPGDDVGMARARSGTTDTWVALVATPLPGVPSFARQYALGDRLELALPAQTTWSLVSPVGVRSDGSGAVSGLLDSDGEWWLDAILPGGRLAVPIYVALDMPAVPVLQLPGEGVAGPDDAVAQVTQLLNEIREAFGVALLQVDPTLETLALAPLEQVQAGTWQHQAQVQRLQDAGFLGGSTDQAWCQAPSVALCLDGLLRTADGRTALLAAGHRQLGAQARVESTGVTVLINLASE